jgi:hypothetical protein
VLEGDAAGPPGARLLTLGVFASPKVVVRTHASIRRTATPTLGTIESHNNIFGDVVVELIVLTVAVPMVAVPMPMVIALTALAILVLILSFASAAVLITLAWSLSLRALGATQDPVVARVMPSHDAAILLVGVCQGGKLDANRVMLEVGGIDPASVDVTQAAQLVFRSATCSR